MKSTINLSRTKEEKISKNNKRIYMLNTAIDVLTFQETIDLVEKYIMNKVPLHLAGVNADKINEINSNIEMRRIINNCDIINPDGASVVIASRFLGKPLPERIAGIDLMESLIQISEKNGYSIYLLGAKQEVVEKAVSVLQKKYPALKICGFHNGYFNKNEWTSISNEIKKLKPNLVFVGITSPIKEYLIEFLQKEGNDSVFMGVGGSFDVLSGKISRAPQWMQKLNLEWIFRMIQEPRRLFRRYFFGNIFFIKMVIGEKYKLKKYT